MSVKKGAEKAYKNLKFLNEPIARPIRILSEYFEPLNRLKKYGIQDTIVFFGSSRIRNHIEIMKEFKELNKRLEKSENNINNLNKKIEELKIDQLMSRYYDDAVKLSYLITKWSIKISKNQRFVVCSGGGPGIMEAANKGAKQAGGRSIGFNISIPLEQKSNRYVSLPLDFEFHYFFMRKFWFVYLAKAMVMFPGGFGTLDELMEVLTLLQTKKIRKKIAIILYGKDYWEQVLNFNALLHFHMISKNDVKLFRFANKPQEAFTYIKNQITNYHLNSSY